jgi:hypothetical protein
MKKKKMKTITKFGVSLIGTIVFGVVDGLMYFFSEHRTRESIVEYFHVDETMAHLAASGISKTIAVFVAFYVHDYLQKRYHLIDNPFLDALGVVVGTLIIMLGYYVYRAFSS